jgi:hypothetical protein
LTVSGPTNTISNVEQRRPFRRQPTDHNFGSPLMLAVTASEPASSTFYYKRGVAVAGSDALLGIKEVREKSEDEKPAVISRHSRLRSGRATLPRRRQE